MTARRVGERERKRREGRGEGVDPTRERGLGEVLPEDGGKGPPGARWEKPLDQFDDRILPDNVSFVKPPVLASLLRDRKSVV